MLMEGKRIIEGEKIANLYVPGEENCDTDYFVSGQQKPNKYVDRILVKSFKFSLNFFKKLKKF